MRKKKEERYERVFFLKSRTDRAIGEKRVIN